MVIERSGFLLIAGTLAAGGVGGWLVHDSKSRSERAAAVPVVTVSPAPVVAPPVASEEHLPAVPALPACDDSVGTAADCPAFGPADEGVCNLAAARCADFKVAFKPKVAQAAVACLRLLKGNELCDPARVGLCGHSALMAACPDPTPSSTANAVGAGALAASPVSAACESILKGCANQPLGPTMADCRQTLSGMSDAGRASMAACMATHCGDLGLLGCEASHKK